jgi:hypothetical protein|tara:strand:+ start:4965 stop:5861 length:897 start_codon:yes stop_codon:yes gene_type:complete
MSSKKIELFLDSGAYSAWTQGTEIDINDYIKFIKKYKKYLNVYANLDVIGDPVATLKNQEKMEKAGLKPLPCFHYKEDEKFLKYYIKKYDYIALGGMVGTHKKQLDKWLNETFGDFICDEVGYPKAKVHGFGLTSLDLMLKYPWYSVDSTSWVVNARMGSIIIPKYKKGEYRYEVLPHKVSVSLLSPDQKTKNHINAFPPEVKKTLLKYIEEKGYELGESKFRTESPDYELKENEKWAEKKVKGMEKRRVEEQIVIGLSNDYKLRDEFNIIYFNDLEEFFPEYPRKFEPRERRIGFGL